MPIVIENLTHAYMPDNAFQAAAITANLTVSGGDFLGSSGIPAPGKTRWSCTNAL